MTDLELFTNATIEALYFTDTGEEDQPAKDAELSEEIRKVLEAECLSFWHRFGHFVMAEECTCDRSEEHGGKPAMAGHDFWLTRNGHGAGFWDGDWSDNYATILSKGAETYGHFQTYLGDDGQIHS
jgi:hypothetical protein